MTKPNYKKKRFPMEDKDCDHIHTTKNMHGLEACVDCGAVCRGPDDDEVWPPDRTSDD